MDKTEELLKFKLAHSNSTYAYAALPSQTKLPEIPKAESWFNISN